MTTMKSLLGVVLWLASLSAGAETGGTEGWTFSSQTLSSTSPSTPHTSQPSPGRPPTCSSDIYCHGPLLHTVQMASLYPDSKTFVDMKMKYSRNETLERFEAMMKASKGKPEHGVVAGFVEDAFEPAGSEFEVWTPSDWKENPKFLEGVADPSFKSWASSLNSLWKELGRKMKSDVKDNPDRYSIIWVPNPVIVPGGRFREFYYWDSYWIVKGLLLSEMFQTVKGMLSNFVSIVDQYGFIPNGGRIYYTMRSQPPLLIPMVESYLEATDDLSFLKDNIDTLEKEYNFWLGNRSVKVEKDGRSYTLVRYAENSSGPRPESYREDVIYAEFFRSQSEKDDFYSELKSAAESGWDFSSRWFISDGTNKGNLTDLKTRSIIPVDLNSILCWNARLLGEFHEKLGNSQKAQEYKRAARDWSEAIEAVLWHEKAGAWLDEDLINGRKRDYFSPSNLGPLWTNCYDPEKREYYAEKVLLYLKRSGAADYPGGLPTTLEHSGEQWDFPNAWPPLQHLAIVGLDATGDPSAGDLAYELAEAWVRSNFKAYNETHAMYEKYDATILGGHGGGGEYEVQLGFGWTNGAIMDLLNKYGSRMSAEDPWIHAIAPEGVRAGAARPATPALSISFALVATLAAGCIGLYIYSKRKTPRYFRFRSGSSYPETAYSKLATSRGRNT